MASTHGQASLTNLTRLAIILSLLLGTLIAILPTSVHATTPTSIVDTAPAGFQDHAFTETNDVFAAQGLYWVFFERVNITYAPANAIYWKTSGDGVTWSAANLVPTISKVANFAGTYYGGLGYATWNTYVNGNSIWVIYLPPGNAQVLIEQGTLLSTGGITWNPETHITTNTFCSLPQFSVNSTGAWFAYSSRCIFPGIVFVSKNSGATWTQVGGNNWAGGTSVVYQLYFFADGNIGGVAGSTGGLGGSFYQATIAPPSMPSSGVGWVTVYGPSTTPSYYRNFLSADTDSGGSSVQIGNSLYYAGINNSSPNKLHIFHFVEGLNAFSAPLTVTTMTQGVSDGISYGGNNEFSIWFSTAKTAGNTHTKNTIWQVFSTDGGSNWGTPTNITTASDAYYLSTPSSYSGGTFAIGIPTSNAEIDFFLRPSIVIIPCTVFQSQCWWYPTLFMGLFSGFMMSVVMKASPGTKSILFALLATLAIGSYLLVMLGLVTFVIPMLILVALGIYAWRVGND